MYKTLRAIARCVFAFVFLSCVLVSLSSEAQTLAPIAHGVQWLSGQVQADGSLQNESLSIATPLQNRSEAYSTLQQLANVSSTQSASIATNTDGNTEYLSRQIVALASAGQNVSTLVAQFAASNNPDGGYGGAPGYASTPLATAFALIALKASGQTAVAPSALIYLQTAQQADGAFLLNGVEDLYSSIYVLSAFHQYAGAASISSNIQLTVKYLIAQQSAPGIWNNSPFLSALAYSALHDFIPTASVSAAVNNYLSGGQAIDGSWGDDPYVTAVVLRALNLAAIAPANPGLATLQGTVVDSQTGLPLAGVNVTYTASGANAVPVSIVTATDGTFTFGNLAPGGYALTATLANYGSLNTHTTLSSGQTVNFGVLQMIGTSGGNTGTLRGIVTDAFSGAPLAGATVTNVNFVIKTDSKGGYQVPNLAAGTFPITVSKIGYQTINATGTLTAGSVLVYSPAMTTIAGGPVPTSATVTGVVLDAGTNRPLAGVTITAVDGVGSHTGKSDASGNFNFASMTPDAKGGIGFTFAFAQYTGSTSYVMIADLAAVNMGQVRLRSITASQLLPDIAIVGIDRSAAVTNPQSLILGGQLSVTVQNLGTVDIQAGVKLLAFQDVNKNRNYDVGTDQVLGTVTLGSTLAIGQSQVVQIPVQGVMPFRDAPITVWADSDQSLIEINKINNIGATGDFLSPPPFSGPIKPTLKWEWTGGPIISTPMVGPLTDTNGDGKYDANDIPTVLVVQAFGSDGAPGMLTALSGKDGKQLWQVTDPTLYTEAEAHPAIADLDGSGAPQVIAYLAAGGIGIFKHDGSLKCTSPVPVRTTFYLYGAITVADLDGDGKGEILADNYVLNNDCTVRMILGTDNSTGGNNIYSPIVADLDGDDKPEIINTQGVYHNDGSLYWAFPKLGMQGEGLGWVTVARLDPRDPHPQVIVNGLATLRVFRYDGTPMWGPIGNIPSSYTGPATIVDLDGNGIPSIAIATSDVYLVYNADGSLRWLKRTSDDSGVTGSTAFDFYQNGKPKIIYFDETDLRLWDGAGTSLFYAPNASATATEYPTVVDVDGSGHAAILAISNEPYFAPTGCCGLRVFQDVNNAWPATRKIWNEYNYHVTNINDDGSLPLVEKNSWDVTNTYRVNPAFSTTLPDVSASLLRVNDQGGTAPSVVTVRIGNAGTPPIAAGLKVALYSGQIGGTLLGTAVTSTNLNSDDYQDVTFSIAGSLSGISTLVAVADDDGNGAHTMSDFDLANNTVTLPLSAFPGSFNLTALGTDLTSYSANSNVQIAATVANHGSFDGNAQIQFVIQNAAGQQVAVLSTQVIAVAHQGQRSVNAIWNTGTVASGSYTLIAQLLDGNGVAYGQLSSSFAIGGGAGAASASVTLSSDKQTYLPSDTVKLTDNLTNLTTNTALNNLNVVTTVSNPSATVVFTKTETLPQLAAATLKNYAYSVPLNFATAGTYNAKVIVTAGDGTALAHATAQFTVASSATTGSGLTGSLSLNLQQVPLGNPLSITYSATNGGNSALAGLPLTVSIVDPVAQKVIASFPTTQTLATGTSYAGADNWTTAGTVGNTYVAVLSATIGGNMLTLGQANFTLIAPPIKLGITKGLWNSNRVLVLTACSDSNGDDGHQGDGHDSNNDKHSSRNKDGNHDQGNDGDDDDTPARPIVCTSARYVAIDSVLTGLGLQHVMTADPTAFTFAMRSGLYDTMWIAGDQSSLGDDLTAEVSEVVYNGASLIVDGPTKDDSANFDRLGGVRDRKKLDAGANVSLNGSFYPNPLSLPTAGAAQSLKLTGSAQVQGTFSVATGDDDPARSMTAMASNVVGSGITLIAGFDLGSTLSTQATAWAAPLNSSFSALTPIATASLTPGQVLPVQIGIANQAEAVSIDVQTSLPSGALYLGSTPNAAFNIGAGIVDWDFDLALSQNNSVYLTMRAPSTGGSYNLQTVVNTVNGGNANPYGNPLVFPITVTPAATTAANAITSLQAMPVTHDSDRDLVKKSIANIDQAMSDFNINTYAGYGKTIDELVEIAKNMGKFKSDFSAAVNVIHAQIDQVLQEAQWRWTTMQPQVKAKLSVDRSDDQSDDHSSGAVTLTEQLTNITSMTVLDDLSVATTVTDPSGAVFFTKTETLSQFAVGEKQLYSYSIPTGNAASGSYAASMLITDANGTTLAQASAKFSLKSPSGDSSSLIRATK